MITIDGTGAKNKTMKLVLQFDDTSSPDSNGRVFANIKQIKVTGGATLNIYFGNSIKNHDDIKEVYIRAGDGMKASLIYVEDGSLSITGASDKNIVLSGRDATVFKENPIVNLRQHTVSMTAEYVNFRQGGNRAILCRAGKATKLELINCGFADTVTAANNGGAIHITEATEDKKTENGTTTYGTYVDVSTVMLNKCTFNSNKSSERGGAVTVNGRVKKLTFNGCTFNSCKATNGGAVSIGGTIDEAIIAGCEFNSCSATSGDGGAIEITSRKMTDATSVVTYSHTNVVEIRYSSAHSKYTTFTNCTATSEGGAIALKSQTYSVTVSDVTFTSCKTTGTNNGGAIAVSSAELEKANWVEQAADSMPSKFEQTAQTKTFKWSSEIRTTYNTVGISGCTFKSCSSTNNGGGVAYQVNSYITSASISGSTFDGCTAQWSGSAVVLGNCIIVGMTVEDNEFKNCDFLGKTTTSTPGGFFGEQTYSYPAIPADKKGAVGGTFRTVGETTCNMKMSNCTFTSNISRIHGGGVYWNANNNRGGVTCAAILEKCTFSGNIAARDGGAIYCEAKVTTSECTIFNNIAYDRGGGIAQQVYSNPDALVMTGGESTDLTLDSETKIFDNKSGIGGGVSIRANRSDSIGSVAIALTHTVRFKLNGAQVYTNKASSHGGGIAFFTEIYDTSTTGGAENQKEVDSYTKKIEIDNGVIRNNIANQKGGGVYMESSQNTTLSVTGGEIYSNDAYNGGGIYMTGNGALCNLSGGTIGGSTAKANKASNNGGGITVAGGSKIIVSGSSVVSYNTAGNHGGGICVANLTPKDEANKLPCNSIYITGGQIKYNTATTYGGGVYIGRKGIFDIASGDIINNTAKNGGGIALYYLDTNDAGMGETDGNYVCSAQASVKGGQISNNTATEDGGGIYAYNYSKVTIQKSTDGKTSTIKENTAAMDGGGVYVDTYSEIELSDGNILSNTATGGNGGGLHATVYSTVTITNGSVKSNSASNGYGGGIHADDHGTVSVSGGTIQENGAKSGAGIAAENSSKVTVSNTIAAADDAGTIYKNVATERGGGIFALTSSEVKVTGGSIMSNEASEGGGIAAQGGAKVTVEGGSITLNAASTGGGVWGYGVNTFIKVLGGNITQNTATGSGGGIYLDYDAEAEISTSTDGSTHGKISGNTAARGGGVYVGSGADLTVNNGYVINNKAVGTPAGITTAYKKNSELAGVGGGIYIADGVNDSNPSSFTLTGSDIAIYGNLADFGADDVFANGTYTKLSVPLVRDMNLAGYGSKADGWFEDYPTSDTSYVLGLNGLNLAEGAATSGKVLRYRATEENVQARVEILTYKVNGNDVLLANVANEYVCMTLGLTGAVDDTIVIDFGLPVDIDTLNNDISINRNNSVIGGLRVEGPTATEMPGTNTDDLLADFAGSIKLSGYTATISEDGLSVRFQLTGMKVDQEVTFWYAVNYNNGYRFYYAKVTVVPATSIYYEDNTTAITYTEYTLSKVNNVTTKTPINGAHWTDTNPGATTGTQGSDIPGVDVDNVLGNLDMDNIYGYDSAYENVTAFSMGSAKMVTVNAGKSASAAFTFKGTGFDLISLTDSTSGLIMVTVKGIGADNATYKKTFMVDNYYSAGAIYQVPVMKVNGLNYGEYSVEIYIAYAAAFDHNSDNQCTFYLDAVRIYDPAKGNTTVENVHQQDGELWPTYCELRNMLIGAGDFDITDNKEAAGVIFIDQHDGEITITDYQNFGPNNELYLAQGQAVAFKLDKDGTNVNQIHLGVRGIGGSAMVKIYDASAYTSTTAPETEIKSTTDMYYNITDLDGKTVVIYNSGSSMISITNVKTTHHSVTATGEEEIILYSGEVGRNALASMVNVSAVPEIVPVSPSLDFADEIRYNVYFTALNAEDIALEDMGLAIFHSKLTDGTVDTAVELVPGAIFDGEEYMVHTNGIPAKALGDMIYFKIYAKLADGTYVYSDLLGYNAVAYAQDILANSSDENMKALVVSMLNYGTAAQQYFGYNTDALMNASLTEAQKAYGVEYSDEMISQLVQPDSNKMGVFATNGGFAGAYPSVSFEGVFAINYYFTPAYPVDGEMTFYYWSQSDYDAANELTAENASGSMVMTAANGVYQAVVGDIAAKQIDEKVYVVGVYESEGTAYTTGVLAYSLSAYCADRIANGGTAMQAFAKATVAYGFSAKTYFAQK